MYIWTIEQTDDGTYQLPERLFRVKLRVSEGTQHAIWNGYELDDIIVRTLFFYLHHFFYFYSFIFKYFYFILCYFICIGIDVKMFMDFFT